MMSAELLKQLNILTQYFEQGIAGPRQIRELADLLAQMNYNEEEEQGTVSSSSSGMHNRLK